MSRAAVHEARVPLRNPAPPRLSPAGPSVQRLCKNHKSGEECAKCSVQRKERSGPPGRKHAPEVDAVLANPGRPLPPALRSDMEARFGSDFSGVRIHDDAAGARAADAVDAHAFAHGNHIAFGAGRFDPDSPDGRWLIAHELAHTVQQSRGGDGVQPAGGEGGLEREADRAASAALAFSPLPPLSAAPASVAKAKTPLKPKPKNKTQLSVAVNAGTLNYDVTVKQRAAATPGITDPIFEVQVEPFYVPRMKGKRGLEVLRDDPPAPLLAVPAGSTGRSAVKQTREDYTDLRENWLRRVSWTAAEANTQWKACGGGKANFPYANGEACHMDHIIELQLGGGGHAENLQALDPSANMTSGNMIREQLAKLSFAIASDPDLQFGGDTRDLMLRMRFKGAKYYGPNPTVTTCADIETQALKGGPTGNLLLKPGRLNYALKMRGEPHLAVEPDFSAKIEDDPDNDALRLVYPGMILTKLDKPTNPTAKSKTHSMHARIDTETSRLPVKVPKSNAKGIVLAVSESADPVVQSNKTNIPIELLFLSPGKITEVEVVDGKTKWTAEVDPTHKFLPKLKIKYANETLSVVTDLNKEALAKQSPIPGARITEAALAVELMPDFKPSGTFAFELEASKRKILATSVRVFAEDNALAADGDVTLFIPRVKSSTGKIKYRRGEWSLDAKVTTGELDLPYLKGGELTATYAKGKFGAEGTLDLALPGNGAGQLGLGYADGKWLFRGTGTIGHPRLGTINVQLRDDGETFTASGDATLGLSKLGLTPTVAAKFTKKKGDAEPKLSGIGTLVVKREKLDGKLTVTLHESGAISAVGTMRYPVRDDLLVEVGVAIDEKQKVTTTGAAKLTKPIDLFKRKGDIYKLKLLDIAVPIPGVSAGPIGLKFGIAAGIDASYYFGPAQLKDVEVSGKINPFAPEVDPVIDLKGTLSVDAGAGLGFWIKGSLIVDGGVAKATGSITAVAGIEAKGNVSLVTTAHYEKAFYSLAAVATAAVDLNLKFALRAGVELTTFLGDYGPGAKWEWTLAEFMVPTGLGFSFSAPVGYHSKEGPTLPSASNIKWVPPERIDAGNLLKRILDAANKKGPPA